MSLKSKFLCAFVVFLASPLTACGGSGSPSSSNFQPPSGSSDDDPVGVDELIKLNQLGFYPSATKMAVVPDVSATSFTVITESGVEVFQGSLGSTNTWSYSDDSVKIADFTDLIAPGRYQIRVDGVADSDAFEIVEDVHSALNIAALKSYYFNRNGMELTAEYADEWARPAGHPDTHVRVHSSAASASRPEGTVISGPEGWYDAGDFNKYIVNSGISTFSLLAAYEHFPEYYDDLRVNIPESGNDLPDILDEALWNIRWMLSMQDPADGGVYHKLTTLNFEGLLMPHEAISQRYVVQKSTDAALNFAAVMAVASRVFVSYETELPGFAARCLEAAEGAWQWAVDNPDSQYIQPADVSTGVYSEPNLNDEFAWAAAELYIATADDGYYTEFQNYADAPVVPSWGYVMALGYLSLNHHADSLTAAADVASIEASLIGLAEGFRATVASSAYAVVMGNQSYDFAWGSNAVALNQSMVLIQTYLHTDDQSYLDAAAANLDYVLGRNALDISFVTGFGYRSPMDIHHRQSAADEVVEPIPGLLAGGPHSGQQDGCVYSSDLPAKSYLDDWCSYSTNEVAINWNAALVYVTGAMEALY